MGRWADAFGELAEVLGARPDDVEALCLLARCHDLAGDPPGTVAAAERALAVAPDHEWALRLRALALIRMKRRRAALRSARAAVAAAPDEWRTHAALVEVLCHQAGIWSLVTARLAADTVLRLASEEADAHLVDAQLCLRTGELAAARRACVRALRLDPGNQTALKVLAVVDLNRDRVRSASRGFTAALALAPDDRVTGTAHGDGARALLWRLFDVLAAATVLHLVAFAAAAGLLGSWRRPVALATAVPLLVGFGLLCRRVWRDQPAAVRWRLRAERRHPGVALWPVAVVAAVVALTLGAYRPADDTFPSDLAALGLAITVIALAVRLLELLVRRGLITILRLVYRTALGLHRGWARARDGRGTAPAGRARG